MPDESLRRVFEPFFSTKFTGRGIGLSEAMGVVRAHRGAIDVDSAPGRGTRVRVLVPLEQSEPRYVPMRRSATHSPRAATHEHLLLVDDVDMLRETLGHALQQRGMQVEGAANGAVGLEMFRADPDRYTAIVLDVTMPVMDGKETLARIRRTHPDVPVILVSGYTEANVAAALSHDDRTLFLQKPFGVTDLLEALRALRGDTAAADD
jgi:CheY-like chemotaxis protein